MTCDEQQDLGPLGFAHREVQDTCEHASKKQKTGQERKRVGFKIRRVNRGVVLWPPHAVKWHLEKEDAGVQHEGFWKDVKRDCLKEGLKQTPVSVFVICQDVDN